MNKITIQDDGISKVEDLTAIVEVTNTIKQGYTVKQLDYFISSFDKVIADNQTERQKYIDLKSQILAVANAVIADRPKAIPSPITIDNITPDI